MAKRVLVPLDTTPEAAAILPIVADTARGAGATVRLLHVSPLPDTVVSEGHVLAYADQEMARLEAEALDRLRGLAGQLGDVAVDAVVRFGDPVEEILAEAAAFRAGVIVLSTKSRSAIGRAVLGSVAEQVFRKADVPVLLYRVGTAAPHAA